MPNWCANRLYIKGSINNIAEVKKLMMGEVSPYYVEAIRKSIKFFIAAEAGIVKEVSETEQKLIASEQSHDANSAFTEWLNLFKTNVSLTEEISAKIVSFYQQSGLATCQLNSLTPDQIRKIHSIFEKQCFDWFGDLGYDPKAIEKYWANLDEPSPTTSARFDMLLLIAPRLAPEIIGFNGHYFPQYADRMTSYSDYVDLYGVKWPSGAQLYMTDISSEGLPANPASVQELLLPRPEEPSSVNNRFIMVDFDTPWSQPKRAVFEALSKKYQCSFAHFYSEAGVAFCGYDIYVDGQLVRFDYGELLYSEQDEEGFCQVIGPDYILNNVGNYGG